MSGEFRVGPASDADLIRLGPAVASGAEGVLYRGWADLSAGEAELAVKMLHPGHLERLSEWTARWRDQVELLRHVHVPGLVEVRGGFVGALPHPRGQADSSTSSLYLLMDWVEGVPLDRWARSVKDAEPEQLLLTLVPVAAALDLLHSGAASKGVPLVHRDVKPANILIRPDSDTVLVDVGSVRGLLPDSLPSEVVGTPGYIAPEVRDEGQWGPAADRYALGAVAFFLLTGTEPAVDATTEGLRSCLEAAPLLAGRSDLVNHAMQMVDPDPSHRPKSLANWVAQLRRSSLLALPAGVGLPPRAPTRHPTSDYPDASGATGAGTQTHKVRRLLVVLALVITVGMVGSHVTGSAPWSAKAAPKAITAVHPTTTTNLSPDPPTTTSVPPPVTTTARGDEVLVPPSATEPSSANAAAQALQDCDASGVAVVEARLGESTGYWEGNPFLLVISVRNVSSDACRFRAETCAFGALISTETGAPVWGGSVDSSASGLCPETVASNGRHDAILLWCRDSTGYGPAGPGDAPCSRRATAGTVPPGVYQFDGFWNIYPDSNPYAQGPPIVVE